MEDYSVSNDPGVERIYFFLFKPRFVYEVYLVYATRYGKYRWKCFSCRRNYKKGSFHRIGLAVFSQLKRGMSKVLRPLTTSAVWSTVLCLGAVR